MTLNVRVARFAATKTLAVSTLVVVLELEKSCRLLEQGQLRKNITTVGNNYCRHDDGVSL